MPRGLIIFLSICGLVAIFGFWGLPWLSHAIFGDTRQVKVIVMSIEDDYDVLRVNKTVARTVAEMEIDFPMGGAPENTGELLVKDPEGRVLEVDWSPPERSDDPDKGLTRWIFRDDHPVFFPIQFRQGALWNKNRELAYFKCPPPTPKAR